MINFQSSEWFQIRRWVEMELERLRLKNDALGLSAEETAAIRGEIRVLKRICGLPEEATRNLVAEPTDF